MVQAERQIRSAAAWRALDGSPDYSDIRLEAAEGIAKITIERPEVRNAFRPQTVVEMSDALERARESTEIGVIVLTGEGPLAFCSGGDQRVRGDSGYLSDPAAGGVAAFTSPTCTCRCDACRSRSSPWSRATRSAAGTCSTSCVT